MAYCRGQIKGDPDIAGEGVVWALFANTAIVIALSSVIWYQDLLRKSAGSRSLQGPLPEWIPQLKQAVVTMGDTQLISALSIIIASLVNILKDSETPLYHIFIARNLAAVSLAGHVAAIINVYPSQHNWSLRSGIMLVTTGLWQLWSLLAVQRFRQFDLQTPYCLENTNVVPGKYWHWICYGIVDMTVGNITAYFRCWESGRGAIDRFEQAVVEWPKNVYSHFKALYQKFRIDSSPYSKSQFSDLLLYLIVTIGKAAGLVVFLAFAFLVPSLRTLGPFQAIFFCVWGFYDVYTARAANAHIIVVNPTYRSGMSFQNNTNPEHDWGFGQIFPLVMLLLPLIVFFDAVYDLDAKRTKKSHS